MPASRSPTSPRRRRAPTTAPEQRELVDAFTAACKGGDLQGLVELLDPDVVLRSDGGGNVPTLPRTVRGATQVASALLHYGQDRQWDTRPAEVNGAPGLVVRDDAGVLTVIAFTVDAGRITAIDGVRNPDKLAGIPELS